jgi:hypothetical protein
VKLQLARDLTLAMDEWSRRIHQADLKKRAQGLKRTQALTSAWGSGDYAHFREEEDGSPGNPPAFSRTSSTVTCSGCPQELPTRVTCAPGNRVLEISVRPVGVDAGLG